jgi:ATP-binding cassette, subfamily B, bacterial PglK
LAPSWEFFQFEVSIRSLIILILIFHIFKYFISIKINKNIISFTQGTELILRKKIFNSTLNIDYLNFIKKDTGEYIYLITELTKAYANGFVMPIIRLFNDLSLLLFISIYFIYFDFRLFLITLIYFSIIIFLFNIIYRRNNEAYGENSANLSSEIISLLSSVYNGYKEIIVNNESRFFLKKFHKLVHDYKDNFEKYLFSTILPKIYYDLAIVLYLLLFVIYLYFFKIENAFFYISTLGLIAFKTLPIVITLSNAFIQINFNKVAFNRIHDIINEFNNLTNSKHNESTNNHYVQKIELNNLSFGYLDSPVISNVNVSFNKGKIYSLIGESGSGKTTILDLLSGLIKTNSNTIKFIDSNGNLIPFINQISYMPQSPFVFNGTFEENITLESEKYSQEKIEKSIKNSQLIELWNNFKKKKLRITENGKNLSGGQRQRIGFARILYLNKDILLLDEFTSALDLRIKSEILKQLELIKKDKIIIISTHDPKVLEICDHKLNIINKNIIID